MIWNFIPKKIIIIIKNKNKNPSERLIGKMCPKLRQKTQKGKDHQDCGGILI